MTTTSTPAVVRIDEGVLLTGQALDVMRYAVQVAQRSRHRNGLPPVRALDALALALAPRGHADADLDDPGQGDDMTTITTNEAAGLLGCSNRQARRLAPLLGGRLAGGRWLLDPLAVTEHLNGRTTE